MAASIPYTLRPEGVTVALTNATTGLPEFHPLHSSHPTFKSLVRALKRKEWNRVPKLISISTMIADKLQGDVELRKEGVFYAGKLIDNSLTKRILRILKEGKSVSAMLKFMDNLHQNPEEFAVNELYDWMANCDLPISDDGRFFAYKRVRYDYKDCYTGTIDNSVGQEVFMERKDVCKDRTKTCEQGLHFCSASYLPDFGRDNRPGDRIMQVVIDPQDVVSIPNDYAYAKGRTWRYEVVKEVPMDEVDKLLREQIDIDDFQTAVYSISKNRKKLIEDILALPTIARMLRKQPKGKIKRGRKAKTEKFVVTERSIRKMTIGRLAKLYKTYSIPEPPKLTTASSNRLEAIRKQHGFSRGQVADKLKASYKTVANWEHAPRVPQDVIDQYIGALIALAKLGDSTQTAIAVPNLTVQKAKAAAASAVTPTLPNPYVGDGHDSFADTSEYDEDYYEEDEE